MSWRNPHVFALLLIFLLAGPTASALPFGSTAGSSARRTHSTEHDERSGARPQAEILAMENKLAEMSKAIQQLEEAKLLLKTRLEMRQLDEDIKMIQDNLESLDERECPWEDQMKGVPTKSADLGYDTGHGTLKYEYEGHEIRYVFPNDFNSCFSGR